MKAINTFLKTAAPLALVVALAGTAFAEDEISAEMFTTNNLWMMMSAALVFIMNLGFATVETGLTRAKNTASACSRTRPG